MSHFDKKMGDISQRNEFHYLGLHRRFAGQFNVKPGLHSMTEICFILQRQFMNMVSGILRLRLNCLPRLQEFIVKSERYVQHSKNHDKLRQNEDTHKSYDCGDQLVGNDILPDSEVYRNQTETQQPYISAYPERLAYVLAH